MNKTDKAAVRLRKMHAFSPQYETFASLFWEHLDRSQTDLAIDLLLRVLYEMLSSDGERFNQLLSNTDPQTADKLRHWLDTQTKR